MGFLITSLSFTTDRRKGYSVWCLIPEAGDISIFSTVISGPNSFRAENQGIFGWVICMAAYSGSIFVFTRGVTSHVLTVHTPRAKSSILSGPFSRLFCIL